MRCVRCPDGIRRFYAATDWETFLTSAFAGGVAVLDALVGLSAEQRQSYRLMWQLFRRIRTTREHLGNKLVHASSLRVSRASRGVALDHSILPESLGLDGSGNGRPWSVDRLLREGRQEARRQGHAHPRERDWVRYGLLVAARQNPLHLQPGESCVGLVRQSLFDSVDWPALSAAARSPKEQYEEWRQEVVSRAVQAIQRHLAESSVDFDRWFLGPNNSFVSQIAKQKAGGEPHDRQVVRRVLQELGSTSYAYVADAIEAMLVVFRSALPLQLEEEERRWFGAMHLKQPYFGGLPFALLAERSQLLMPAVWNVWANNDDPEQVAVLHRLLAYYGEMAVRRRECDRRLKHRAGTRWDGGYALDCELNLGDESNDVAATERLPQGFLDVAEQVRQHRGIVCDCQSPAWTAKVAALDDHAVVLEHGCEYCGAIATTPIQLTELRTWLGAEARTV
jgi:hypothetical protein